MYSSDLFTSLAALVLKMLFSRVLKGHIYREIIHIEGNAVFHSPQPHPDLQMSLDTYSMF